MEDPNNIAFCQRFYNFITILLEFIKPNRLFLAIPVVLAL